MLCSPTNAYPNNNCVDGNNFSMKITFNGDYTIGADFHVYDYNTEEQVAFYYERGKSTNGFRNGEEIDIVHTSALSQNKEYLWRVKFYEKIDINNGYYPDVYSSKGTVQKNPITKVTVVKPDFEVTQDNYIPIETGLDITVPCYLYWQGHERKLVTNYHKTKGVLKLDTAYETKPTEGTELYLSTVKVVSLDSVISETGLIPVEKGLNIDTGTHWEVNKGESAIPNTYIKVNGNYYGITKYYSKTGLLGIDGTVSKIDEGTPYQIYQCFVISPYYYFTTKATPTITPTMTFVNEVIKCEASIDTAGNYPVEYFYWSIYKDNVLINQSEKIYSGRLEYLFREIETDSTYTGKITVVTQDGIEVTSDVATCTIPAGMIGITDLKAEFDTAKNAVKLTWKNADGVVPTSYMILRKDEDNNIQYLETVQKKSVTQYIDYSCGNNATYQYIVIPKTTSTIYQQGTVTIKTAFDGWQIYFLTEVPYTRPSTSITDVRIYYNYMYGDKQFKVTNSWKVEIEPEIDNITHNIKRDKNDTYRGKPVVTYGNMDYDSFTLKFILGNISCPDNELTGTDYRTFQRWKADINSKLPVMIKDSNGHVWFGSVTEHSYLPDYAGGNYQLYTINLDFVQTRYMQKTRILTD